MLTSASAMAVLPSTITFPSVTSFPPYGSPPGTFPQLNGGGPVTGISPASAEAPSPAALPAPGGFSLRKLLSTKADIDEPGKVRSHSIAAVFATESEPPIETEADTVHFTDALEAGIVSAADAEEYFAYYYDQLNPMTSLLDPILHDLARKDAFLFTAVCTVSAKEANPAQYPALLTHSRRLLGQAFEHGRISLELIQAIALLVFWVDAQDSTGARRLSYALRCGSELGLHKRTSPLPADPMEARRVLNRERTALYLCVADHRFSTQRGLPKMIPASERRHDTCDWIHSHVLQCPCPSEAGLAPLGAMAKLLDLYEACTTPSRPFEGPDEQVLACLESEFTAWQVDWTGDTTRIALLPPQTGFVRFYGKVLRFNLDEVHLTCAIMSRAPDATPARTISAFKTCVHSALDVLATLRGMVERGTFVPESNYIGTASAAVWLATNASGLTPEDRRRVLDDLAATVRSLNVVANGRELTMAAYTSRLVDHWIKKIEPPLPPSGDTGQAATPFSRPFVTASLNSNFFDSQWAHAGAPSLWQADLDAAAGNSLGVVPGMPAAPNFFDSIMPGQSLEQDIMYPPLDDQLWSSLFPQAVQR